MKKKFLIGCLTLTGISLSGLSISCSRETNEVDFAIPFSIKDERAKSLQKLVNKFNQENLIKNKDDKPVVLNFYQSRQDLYQKLSIQLKTNDPAIASILMYYPSASRLIFSYKKEIEVSDVVSSSNILPEFLKTNQYINTEHPNSYYILPSANSTDMLVANKLNLGYVLNELDKKIKENNIKKNVIASENADLLNEALNHYKKISSENEGIKNAIENFWGLAKKNIDVNILNTLNLEYTDDIFKYNYDLLKIANDFGRIININKQDKTEKKVFYHKHIANFIYSLAFNEANANFDDYFLKYNSNNLLNYDVIYNQETPESKTIKTVFEKISDTIKNGGLQIDATINSLNRILPPAAYDTIFSISTNNAYNWITNGQTIQDKNGTNINSILKKDDFIFKQAPTKNQVSQTKGSFLIQGLNIMGISHFNQKDKTVKRFFNWLYSAENKRDWNGLGENNPFIKSLTPIEFFAYQNNYIFPSNNFLNNYDNKSLNKNESNLNLISEINKIKTNENAVFEEPVDGNSDYFRNKLISIMKQYYLYGLRNTDNQRDFEWFINALEKEI
ncbi:P80 family lipoprotein [[Mycoplasma] anseris]|uniref:Mycoplasma lipoprotein C-terminal domain-containing protein n=1 Tax=[Mycoplasma] anseris TaxID=92400 RepID=A0A2Z4ND84_9BACT|nr:P80 family lipoprotein [[Mycoplasma] anseris]AWX69542.1 hypothetical protein DP065_02135 [[Mycoplasma] anseris]